MTAERRLAKVEAALTPTQRVLVWLDEAHAFGSLSAYVDSLLDQPPDVFPINRLAREAATATRAALRGKRPETVDAAVRKCLRATIFRFELVMRINVVTHEMIDREVLIYAVFAGQLALLAGEDRPERLTEEGFVRRLCQCRDITMSRVDEMLAAQEARSIVEERYLDGRGALFPDAADGIAERLLWAHEQAAMAAALAELDGLDPVAPTGPDALSARAAALVMDFVEPSRASALDKLDEGRQALTIATKWLRLKNERSRADAIGNPALEAPTP